ncbi:membrane-bound lytic murein transglycosylase C [mine drainage metagenome]|uniref:Membrane-bound lytic murein transglycosylase C n=1 Tax=mine drainage metagenome TaxID=410659 RepID=A0A1J5RSE6_9ZZZZ
MSQAILLSNWGKRKAEFVLNFMQGGLMASGLILGLALAALLAKNPAALDALRSLQVPPGQVQASPGNDALKSALSAEPDSAATLTPEMHAALDFASRRYRVSAEALDPVFLAAQAAGRRMHLDPLLIVAVIAIESRFNPFAESVVGAQGLMQVMPRWHHDKLPEGAGALTLFDPVVNIEVGAQVLRESIRRMGGLIPGLQQFAGDSDDPEQSYANKVLAEKQQMERAARLHHGA